MSKGRKVPIMPIDRAANLRDRLGGAAYAAHRRDGDWEGTPEAEREHWRTVGQAVMEAITIYAGSDACPRCLGWKRVANSDDGESWKYWAELPPPSNLAVQVGVVYPIVCPKCLGTGRDIRETLGRIVRDAWIAWAKEQEETKDSWFSPWEELGEPFKEADRRIGMAVLDFLHTMAEENP